MGYKPTLDQSTPDEQTGGGDPQRRIRPRICRVIEDGE